jgi:hypothetical protein
MAMQQLLATMLSPEARYGANDQPVPVMAATG